MDGDDECSEEQSHMSDYDAMGLAPGHSEDGECDSDRLKLHNCEAGKIEIAGNTGRRVHCEDSRFRMMNIYGEADETRECERNNEEPERSDLAKQDKQTKNNGMLSCFCRGERKTSAKNMRYDSDEDESGQEDADKLVCNMNGNGWEHLPFPVVVDSGASVSVLPEQWRPHVPTVSTPQSQQGEFYRVANGNKIRNKGQKFVTMMTREGAQRDMKFTACDVAKALTSVSQMCRAGNRVAFNPPMEFRREFYSTPRHRREIMAP